MSSPRILRVGTRVRHFSTGDIGYVTCRDSRDPNIVKVLWVSNFYHGWIEKCLIHRHQLRVSL